MKYKKYPTLFQASIFLIILFSFILILLGLFLDPGFYFFLFSNIFWLFLLMPAILTTIEFSDQGITTRFGKKMLHSYHWSELRHVYLKANGRSPITVHLIFDQCLDRKVMDFYDFNRAIKNKRYIKIEYISYFMKHVFEYYHGEIYHSDRFTGDLPIKISIKDGYISIPDSSNSKTI